VAFTTWANKVESARVLWMKILEEVLNKMFSYSLFDCYKKFSQVDDFHWESIPETDNP